MADATLYRTAGHPEKARLVFNAQLHQQLKNIAKNREISAVPGAPTISSNGSMRPTQPMVLNGAGRSTELNGWSLEKKMVAMVEALDLLRRPFFFYLDFGTAAAAEASNGGSAGASGDRKLTYHSYFNKMLPLHVGQTVLLDLWDYLMDMVDHVPQVHLDSLVSKRYIRLLERSVRFCSVKIRKARFMAEEHRFFVAHIYTAVYFRFPFTTPKLLEAVLKCTEKLEGTGEANNGTSNGSNGNMNGAKNGSHPPKAKRRRPTHRGSVTGSLRSPRQYRRHWNDLSDRISGVDLQLEIFSSFSEYKSNRGTDRLVVSVKEGSTPGIPQDMLKKGSSNKSIAAALEAVFQQGMNRVGEEQEVTFIYQLPLLYIGHKLQNDAFVKLSVTTQDKIEAGVDLFIERVKSPGRDDLMAVTFVAAVLSDVSSWCNHRYADGRILWHCVPGYFTLVRLYVAVFERMCQRRARSSSGGSSMPSVNRILSIIEGKTNDPWEEYWNDREIDTVLDAGSEVLKNEALVNVLMQVILESTNILDPTSVNYSFGILQRMLEVASMAAMPAAKSAGSSPGKFGGRVRHCLGAVFDGDYFLSSMRSALQSSHVQTLLKVLTCIYNCIDLLPTTARKRLVAELILRENFFHFFLHWNEEIRKIFCYMIVFKTSASNRLDLPSASDRILLAQTPFYEVSSRSKSNGSSLSAASPALSYLSHLSELAQAMLRPTADSEMDPAKKAAVGKKALQRLMNWDASARLKRTRTGGDAVFRDSLVDEELSVDLSIASKLDANFKMVAEQMDPAKHRRGNRENGELATAKRYFPRELEAYAERALSQYVLVLWEYYEAAFENPSRMPIAPSLEFTIAVPFFSD
ncbi:putative membrane protein [Phytophthora megakarya]|uniref:Putative membrane protein n=1 Tax=Phytophthora megakarya TaxID=4795 RepID=A0A225WJH4_9STRA|nr:putative membrane protein [Phytophthora megakarya]